MSKIEHALRHALMEAGFAKVEKPGGFTMWVSPGETVRRDTSNAVVAAVRRGRGQEG